MLALSGHFYTRSKASLSTRARGFFFASKMTGSHTVKKSAHDNDMLGDLMPREETAQALRTSPRSLDRWHTNRTGPPRFLVGGRVFYDRRDVNNWLADQKEKAMLR